MNTVQKIAVPGRWGYFGVALGLAASCAWGGITTPLYVGNVEPVQDPHGRPMAGSNLSADAADRSRVELRVAPFGGLRATPSTNGVADPRNPLVTPDSVGGIGMNAALPDSGLFCMVFPDRLPTNEMVFARAYNAPTAAEATFYADSFPVRIPSRATESSVVLVFEAAQPLDPGDDDGDGLVNSWERLLGTDDRASADYDEDGMSDYHEMLAGTDPTDRGSLLVLRSIRRGAAAAPAGTGGASTKPILVSWQSVPGMKYQLQYVSTLLGAQEFIPVLAEDGQDFVTADAGEYEIEMRVDVSDGMVAGAFRVKLVR